MNQPGSQMTWVTCKPKPLFAEVEEKEEEKAAAVWGLNESVWVRDGIGGQHREMVMREAGTGSRES